MVLLRGPIPLSTVNEITREEIRLTVQMHLMTIHRRRFLRQELDIIHEKMKLNGSIGRRPPTSGVDYDRDEIRSNLNTKLRLHRSLIRRQAQYIDDMLYHSSSTLEEYHNLDDLEERMHHILDYLNCQISA